MSVIVLLESRWCYRDGNSAVTIPTYPVQPEAPVLLLVVDEAMQLILILGQMDTHCLCVRCVGMSVTVCIVISTVGVLDRAGNQLRF